MPESVAVTIRPGGEVVWRLTVAKSWLARLRGLIGRPRLEPDTGIYLPGTNGVHMFFMRFAIDCIFVGAERADGSRAVVAVRPDLAPWTGLVLWIRGARGAIELGAGSAAAAGVAAGDYLMLTPVA